MTTTRQRGRQYLTAQYLITREERRRLTAAGHNLEFIARARIELQLGTAVPLTVIPTVLDSYTGAVRYLFEWNVANLIPTEPNN